MEMETNLRNDFQLLVRRPAMKVHVADASQLGGRYPFRGIGWCQVMARGTGALQTNESLLSRLHASSRSSAFISLRLKIIAATHFPWCRFLA